MFSLRATALGLTGLLLLTSSSALVPVQASRPSPAAGPSAASADPVGEQRVREQASDDEDPHESVDVEALPATSLTKPVHGAEAVRKLGDDLAAVAKSHDMRPAELRATLRTDETLWVAPTGRLFVKEEARTGQAFDAAEIAPPTAPLDQTFALHSAPGSRHVIHLDFDGVDVPAASAWVTSDGLAAGQYEGWDPMGDGPGFSDPEREAIQEIWARVAEDYAPFDVDVTTADPGEDALRVNAPGDTEFGTRLVVTDAEAPAALCPEGCGGVAWLNQIDRPVDVAEPAWVFADSVSQSPKAIAEAASHEVGHTFGLRHDGINRGGVEDEYYDGHGTWAPIMGTAYDAPVSQWSRGFYDGATNAEDDVALIAAVAGHRTDEGGDDWDSPLRATGQTAYVTHSSDRDVYLVDECTPGARAAAVTAGVGANLDVELTLAKPSALGGQAVKVVNPFVTKVVEPDDRPWYVGGAHAASGAQGLDATVELPEGGPWLLQVRGGDGVTDAEGDFDYLSEGSLGAYRLKVQGCTAPMVPPARTTGLVLTTVGDDLVASWSAPSDDGGSPLTGYRLTLNGQEPVDVAPGTTTHTFAGAALRNVTVGVRALNAHGAGAAATEVWNRTSVPSQVTGVTVATEGITCSFGPRGITVSWSNPVSNGGSPVLRYELWQGQDGEWWKLFDEVSSGGTETKGMCFNPVAGEQYDYRIVAVNAVGDGAPYEFEALLAGPPARIDPTVTTDRDARTVSVTWRTPFDGGAPIKRMHLALTDGRIENPVDVVLPPGATSYTFTGVKTGPKHVLIAAENVWGPADAHDSPLHGNITDQSFEMPPISPYPGAVDANSIRWTVLDRTSGSIRVSWDPRTTADPQHDPILWYDVCVDTDGGVVAQTVQLPGNALFGDGSVRGTNRCGGGTSLALTADATDQPFIDLTGLPIGKHYVAVTPVNPGGPDYMPAMKQVSFETHAITCPTTYAVYGDRLSMHWTPPEAQVLSYAVRTRRLGAAGWTDWSSEWFPTGMPVWSAGFDNQQVTPGEWQVEVTATLNLGGLVVGPPVVCSVTVPPFDPEPTWSPDPTPEPTWSPDPTDTPTVAPTAGPTPTPTPTPPLAPTPTRGPSPSAVPTPTRSPTPAPKPTAKPPVRKVPSAPKVSSVKPGAKGGAKTLKVTWRRSATAGSSAVTRYQVTVYKVKGRKLVVASRKTVVASKRTLTLKLKTGKYKVDVRAKNSVGWSGRTFFSKAVTPR